MILVTDMDISFLERSYWVATHQLEIFTISLILAILFIFVIVPQYKKWKGVIQNDVK